MEQEFEQLEFSPEFGKDDFARMRQRIDEIARRKYTRKTEEGMEEISYEDALQDAIFELKVELELTVGKVREGDHADSGSISEERLNKLGKVSRNLKELLP